jgi:hypothetical protein
MLKRLAILAAVSALMAVCAPGQPNKTGSGKNQPSSKGQLPPTTIYTYDAQCCTTQAAQKANEEPSRWYTHLERPDWWLLLAAIGTLIVIGRQTIQTRRAADATRDSVNAIGGQSALLKRQADAMDRQNKIAQDRERARLVIWGRPAPPDIKPWIAPPYMAVTVWLFVANEGATKAFNVKAFSILRIVRSPKGEQHEDGFLQDISSTIPNTDGKEDLPKITLTGMGSKHADFVAITEATAENIGNRTEFLQVSGNILYEDLFGNSHETPFQYVWIPWGNDIGDPWPDQSYWQDIRPQSVWPRPKDDEGQEPN